MASRCPDMHSVLNDPPKMVHRSTLGVEVEAPSDILIVYPNGKYKIGYDGKGKMITFKPQKRK